MGNTEKVHQLFRGASEVTKTLRLGALACDVLAAVIAILVKPKDPSAWLPLAVLAIAILASGLRAYSSAALGFSQRCRRISLRAYCLGIDVDQQTVSLLDDDAPPFVDQMTKSLRAKTMNEYYEPDPGISPGPQRQNELYAHSAFFTWRLLRVQAIVFLVIGLLILVACAVLIYNLAASTTVTTDRHAWLEAVCTVILISFCVRSFEASWDAYSSYSEIRSIENALLAAPTGDALKDLVDSYDIERAAGANPMTLIYRFYGNKLAEKWRERRKTFPFRKAQTP